MHLPYVLAADWFLWGRWDSTQNRCFGHRETRVSCHIQRGSAPKQSLLREGCWGGGGQRGKGQKLRYPWMCCVIFIANVDFINEYLQVGHHFGHHPFSKRCILFMFIWSEKERLAFAKRQINITFFLLVCVEQLKQCELLLFGLLCLFLFSLTIILVLLLWIRLAQWFSVGSKPHAFVEWEPQPRTLG